jgi:hypothetical protein
MRFELPLSDYTKSNLYRDFSGWAVKSILLLKPFFIYLFEDLEMVLYALEMWRILGVTLTVCRFRHAIFPPFANRIKTE